MLVILALPAFEKLLNARVESLVMVALPAVLELLKDSEAVGPTLSMVELPADAVSSKSIDEKFVIAAVPAELLLLKVSTPPPLLKMVEEPALLLSVNVRELELLIWALPALLEFWNVTVPAKFAMVAEPALLVSLNVSELPATALVRLAEPAVLELLKLTAP